MSVLIRYIKNCVVSENDHCYVSLKHCLVVVTLLLCSCAGLSIDKNVSIERVQKSSIDQSYANLRSKQVSQPRYRLSMDLTKGKVFSGKTVIDFNLHRNDIPLTLDFTGGSIDRVEVNGVEVEFQYNGWFMSLSTRSMSVGPQQLVVWYQHEYSSNGSGLYRYTDAEDGRVYLYTDFEPFDANQVFPLFDQPDLKARFTLDVSVPKHWQVVSYAREVSIDMSGEEARWYFPESAVFSSYLFSLHAGEYWVWEDSNGSVPLRLFARQSIKNYVAEQDWFNYTRNGFDFFQKYFDVDYPFVKYDQVIVPDFNAGAMENVAAVTFSERFIKRGVYAQEDRDRINSVILHEMAHMWFGNLVTMQWWNGLWLNESFATYMSYLAAAETDGADKAWLRFFQRYKQWAYDTDEQVTRHAIELPVSDSDSAFSNFDGITYGKGASVLKQLSYLLGDETFRSGVSAYLKQKSFSNSELSDFVKALEEASGRDLSVWADQWLYQSGMNSFTVSYQCEPGVRSGVQVEQKAEFNGQVLREHRFQLELFGDAESIAKIDATILGDSAVVELDQDLPCAEFVYPNANDWAYVKVLLSNQDLSHLSENISNYPSPLLRAMLWRNLWEAVVDGRIALSHYTEIFFDQIEAEENPTVLRQVLNTVEEAQYYYAQFANSGRAIEHTASNFSHRLQELAWQSVNQAEPGSDVQTFWFNSFVNAASEDQAVKALKALLSGAINIQGLDVDQDRRWQLIRQLAVGGEVAVDVLVEQELLKDRSDRGKQLALAIRAALPGVENKRDWLMKIQQVDNAFTLAEKKQIMMALFSRQQQVEQRTLLGDVLSPITRLSEQEKNQFLKNYSRHLIRGSCTQSSLMMLQEKLADKSVDTLSSLHVAVTKALRIAVQRNKKCMAVRVQELRAIEG